jgi:hypothetical protein
MPIKPTTQANVKPVPVNTDAPAKVKPADTALIQKTSKGMKLNGTEKNLYGQLMAKMSSDNSTKKNKKIANLLLGGGASSEMREMGLGGLLTGSAPKKKKQGGDSGLGLGGGGLAELFGAESKKKKKSKGKGEGLAMGS